MKSNISVVIPVYNGEPYIAATIESVINQTQPPFEIIILDNASTDNTARVVDVFSSNPLIKVFRNKTTIPPAEQWNKAVSLTNAPYFSVLSADDLLLPDHIMTAGQVISEFSEIVLFYCANITINEYGEQFAEKTIDDVFSGLVPKKRYLERICEGNLFYTPGVVIKRSGFDEIGGFDTEYDGALDYDLYIRLGGYGQVYGYQKPLAAYRFHTSQHSSQLMTKMTNDADVLFDKIDQFHFLDENQQKILVENLSNSCHQFYYNHLRNSAVTGKQIAVARHFVITRLNRWASSGRPYARWVKVWPEKNMNRIAFLCGLSPLIARLVAAAYRCYDKRQR